MKTHGSNPTLCRCFPDGQQIILEESRKIAEVEGIPQLVLEEAQIPGHIDRPRNEDVTRTKPKQKEAFKNFNTPR